MEKLESIPVDPDSEEIKKRLHTEQCGDWPRVKTLMETAQSLMTPKAVYRVSDIEERIEGAVAVAGIRLTSRVLRKQLDRADRVFPYVITLGNRLEETIRDCRDIVEQYYLDTIANVALGSVRKHLECHLMSEFEINGLSSLSPGSLSDWPIEEQLPLFSILGDVQAAIGVKVTENLLMVPTKSISGIFFPSDMPFVACQLCGRKNCDSRKAGFDKTLAKAHRISEYQDIH